MHLGFGIYRHQLDSAHLDFARQCGATHVVLHMVDYFRSARSNPANDQPVGDDRGWGLAGDPNHLWTVEELSANRKQIESHGLVLSAIENFDPAHWNDVLLDGPKKQAQLQNLATIIRNVGAAGIPMMGYNFSIAGVAGRSKKPCGRGHAEVVVVDSRYDKPIPKGMVWNMVYDENADSGILPTISEEQLWGRLGDFLSALIPVAEQAGVALAAHPDDPPMPTVRGQPRLVHQPRLYQRLIDLQASPSNQLEFCLGTLAEMSEGDIYQTVDTYSRQHRIGYIHFRNVRGRVPNYQETFIDAGDVDMLKVLRILKENDYRGMLIPDHVPGMSCASPWHAGMAFACGYMRAAMQSIGVV